MIAFNHVSKVYTGQSKALSDVSVQIQDGEFIFLIGPSGAGKTTFLRLLIRDILPTSGTILVNDWELNTLHTSKIFLLRRLIGTVFQDFKLLLDRTIYENVALGLEILGKNEKTIEKDVADILNLVGLADKHDLFPLQLSAGELQRTSIARAIVGGPKILLADEPTGNLDPDTAWDILRILEEIHKLGTTIIMATHNAAIVNDLKRRTLTLNGGCLMSDEQEGKYITRERHKHKVQKIQEKPDAEEKKGEKHHEHH